MLQNHSNFFVVMLHSHCCSYRQRFTGGELLQDFCQVLQSFSMETFFPGGDVGVWTLKRIYKSILIHNKDSKTQKAGRQLLNHMARGKGYWYRKSKRAWGKLAIYISAIRPCGLAKLFFEPLNNATSMLNILECPYLERSISLQTHLSQIMLWPLVMMV